VQNIARCFVIEMSSEKSETIAFLGKDPLRRKIIADNKCLQQVKNFKYLSCKIAYENKKQIQ
jgi:phage major head subunit gpT-like protein